MQRPNDVLALLALAAAAVLGCGDRTLTGAGSDGSPAATPAYAPLAAKGKPNTGFLLCDPLPYDSASRTIDRAGGVIRVGPHILWITPGAVRSPVTITAVAPSDTLSFVRLRPEGLVFARPVSLIMSYRHCDARNHARRAHIAHLNDAREVIENVPSKNMQQTRRVVGQLEHFSNYAIAW